jgi:hypothetical protein
LRKIGLFGNINLMAIRSWSVSSWRMIQSLGLGNLNDENHGGDRAPRDCFTMVAVTLNGFWPFAPRPTRKSPEQGPNAK